MKTIFPRLAAACVFLLSGCTAAGETAGPDEAAASPDRAASLLWNSGLSEDAVRAASCDEGGDIRTGLLALQMTAAPLNPRQSEVLAARLPGGAALAGAWELTSPDPAFGGLSGLALLDETTLLAVTDAGSWVMLGLDGAAPSSAAIGYMRGAGGRFLSGKTETDAEALAYGNGIAFVSFERDFRIEAFAVGACGASAKAVEIAKLPSVHEGRTIDGNKGPEALTLTPQGSLRFGYEGGAGNVSPIGDVSADGQAFWSGDTAANPDGFALVAMDTISLPGGELRGIYLYRAFDPLRGARSVLVWGAGAADRISLSRPVMTDNFEGLAVRMLETGKMRAWIVSDNNFSKQQRTLLFAFDLPV